MGKKRTHAETKDGFAKPPPDTNRTAVKSDKKDKRKNGEHKARSTLVSDRIRRCC
jgi:ribosome biogenesis protein MAK21